MHDRDGYLLRFVARVRALTPDDWLLGPGRMFRRTFDAVLRFNREHVQIEEKIEDAPSLAWKAVEGAALQKHASATLQYAQEESQRIQIEQQKRVLEAKVRQENATADKLEAEARIFQIRELEARYELARKLRDAGITFVTDNRGVTNFIPVPPGYDWHLLTGRLEEPTVAQSASAPSGGLEPSTGGAPAGVES